MILNNLIDLLVVANSSWVPTTYKVLHVVFQYTYSKWTVHFTHIQEIVTNLILFTSSLILNEKYFHESF